MTIRTAIRPIVLPLIPVTLAVLVLTAGRPEQDRGKEIFDTVCSACHSLTPPPLKAPPMLMVAGHYVQATGTQDAAREAMIRWIPAPDTARMILPAHAATRFGPMAPLPLPEDDLKAVVDYIFREWAAAEGTEPRGPMCEGAQCGQGMQHRHGMQPDSSRPGMMPGHGMQMRHGMAPDTSAQGAMMCRRGEGQAGCAGGACAGGMCRKMQQGQ
jgi:hypothetical protein